MQLRNRLFLFIAIVLSSPSAWAQVCGGDVFSESPRTDARPHLIIFSAPSGGGKTTLANLLIKEFPNLKLSISSTTRAPRGTEQNGTDYFFLSQADFKARRDAGKFAEWAEVHGNYYGTDAEVIRDAFKEGKSVLALVDTKGMDNLRKHFSDDIFTIFVSPPDMTTLESRLRSRGTETEEAIQRRLKNAQEEMKESGRFAAVVVNDDLEAAHQELAQLLRDFHLVP